MKLYSRKRRSKTNGERGFTLFEVMAVLGIIAIVGSMMASSWADNAKNMKAKATAEKLQMVVQAAEDYMVANRADLLTLTGGGGVIAIPAGKTCAACAQPATPGGLQTIQADGYLPSSFIDSNTDQQSHALLVKQVGGELEAIVTTYGGASVADDQIGYISSLLGASAGGVYNNAVFGPNNQISGAQGSWGDTTANWAASIGGTPVTPSAGTVQVSMSMAEISGPGIDPDDVLHRTAQTDTSLNTMDTTLRMGGNNITNGGTIAGTNFIDQNDGNYYVNPNGASRISTMTATGTVSATRYNDTNSGTYYIDPSSTSVTNIMTANRYNDRNSASYYLDPSSTSITNVMEANRFNDRNNASYYLDLDGTSNANIMSANRYNDRNNGSYYLDPSSTSVLSALNVNGATNLNTLSVTGVSNFGTTNTGALRPSSIDVGSGTIRTDGWITGNRFEDSEDTTRFVNPGGTSQMNFLELAGWGRAPIIYATTRMESPVYVTTSDRRLKDNIKDLEGLEIVKKLEAKSYNLKDGGKESMGFIAQDIEKFLPFAVHTNEETGMKAVNYIELIAPMADAIQELEERLKELEGAEH